MGYRVTIDAGVERCYRDGLLIRTRYDRGDGVYLHRLDLERHRRAATEFASAGGWVMHQDGTIDFEATARAVERFRQRQIGLRAAGETTKLTLHDVADIYDLDEHERELLARRHPGQAA